MDLNKIVQKIEKLQHAVTVEKIVDLGELKFTLRPLTTMEEIALHEVANEKQSDGINYLLTIKQETLGYSIYKIDDELIPEFIESGEGKSKESLGRHLFIKTKIIQPMSQPTIDALFNAYLVLNLELQEKVQKAIKFDNADAINKYLEDEAEKTVEKTVDKVAAEVTTDVKVNG